MSPLAAGDALIAPVSAAMEKACSLQNCFRFERYRHSEPAFLVRDTSHL
jgi:hypothetical protein